MYAIGAIGAIGAIDKMAAIRNFPAVSAAVICVELKSLEASVWTKVSLTFSSGAANNVSEQRDRCWCVSVRKFFNRNHSLPSKLVPKCAPVFSPNYDVVYLIWCSQKTFFFFYKKN